MQAPLLRVVPASSSARFLTLAIFCSLTFCNAFLWITFAPIASLSSAFYGVGIFEINMLSAVFMLMYGVPPSPLSPP